MKTERIHLLLEKEVKEEAQKIANDLGLSLSSIINAYLKQMIRKKTIYFGISANEAPENAADADIEGLVTKDQDY